MFCSYDTNLLGGEKQERIAVGVLRVWWHVFVQQGFQLLVIMFGNRPKRGGAGGGMMLPDQKGGWIQRQTLSKVVVGDYSASPRESTRAA